MPNIPLAANPAALPNVGALLTAPADDNADRELLVLVLRAKAIARDLAGAEAAFNAARARLAAPPVPAALIWRARDAEMFPRIECTVGDALALVDVQILRAARDAIHQLARICGDVPCSDVAEALGRAAEIDVAARTYFAALDAARRGSGVDEAEAAYERLDADLGRVWREIAFTPARSLLAVLAKLDAVSSPLAAEPLAPRDFPERCSADDVARMAAADLGALLTDHREA